MRRSNVATLQDVANAAGVHVMTVSVVVNGAKSSTRVSDATRTRILDAAARLQYRPNAVARGLLRGRMGMIGVVGIVHSGAALNHYFHGVLDGILAGAFDLSQSTCILAIQDWEADESKILEFCDGCVDGIVLFAPQKLRPEFAETLRRRAPFVMVHSNDPAPGVHDLEIDDEDGAYTAVRYMIGCGHSRIAHFPGDLVRTGAQRRHHGYLRALADAGIAFDERWLFPGWFTFSSGEVRIREMAERFAGEASPTAIFCGNDAVAFGCIERLARNGIRVPDQISVMGFDDCLAASTTIPPLTTVRQPLRRMGQAAVHRLMALVRSPSGVSGYTPDRSADAPPVLTPDPERWVEQFPVELVIRGSVAPPPGEPLRLRVSA